MKCVIIGGVAGGAGAAARLRRLDENAEIIVLERGGHVSFANCGLPYYVGGVIEEKSDLLLQTPQSFKRRFNVDVRIFNEAIAIDIANKIVTVKDKAANSEYSLGYDKLLIATGAEPIKLPFEKGAPVFTLRSPDDAFRLESFCSEHKPATALVIGGGYIGLEIAENLFERGIDVTVTEAAEHILAPLDYDTAREVEKYAAKKGLKIITSKAVGEISRKGGGIAAEIGGEKLGFDFAVCAVGVRPDTAIARTAGIKCDKNGAIFVDDSLRTSAKDVFAVGDAVLVKQFVSGKDAYIPLAGPANKQARIAADNIAGGKNKYNGTQGSSVLKIFGATVAATGLNEKYCLENETAYHKVYNYSPSHATYYPDASNISVKTLFDPEDGRILGAQLFGLEGVDKRCDVLAAAIRAGLTVYDLTELELCYAPPYSSAKDPVNMVGFTAENVLTGKVKQFFWHDVARLKAEGAALIDVRTPAEFSRGHIDGAQNFPLDTLRDNLGALPKDKPLYVNCQSGLRSYIACRILSGSGFDCFNLAGGYRFYDIVVN